MQKPDYMDKPIINKKVKVQKFPGKGGWTYVILEYTPAEKRNSLWVKVKGTVNGAEIDHYKLASMKNGVYMLPLKAEIRKKYNIKEGDVVDVCLYLDNSDLIVPEEILECLEGFPKALEFFNKMTESNKKFYIDWVTEAKNIDTKVNRINKMIDRLLEGKRMYDV
jgi:bifunctional DNA-binding transcriptional regulator/antitoxin component of YhaV-PrlF toxin-antitoxin module